MKKALIILGSIMLVFLLAVGGYAFYLYKSVQSTIDSQMHTALDRDKTDKRDMEVNMDDREPLSFLLLGVDAEDSVSGRTDTIMVVTVNPDDESMRMVSIPRDTRMEIAGRGTQDKVNHAYAFGGADMAIATVENYLDIPIDYFLTVNMDGFKEMVDSVGGVTVYNDFSFRQSGYEFDEGELFLDGDQALAYARMRKEDSRGDLGRNDRQRQIVNGMIKEGAQLSSVTRAESILDALGNNMMTNLTFDKMIKLQQNYRDARHNQETMEIEGSGERIDGIWYLQVPDNERERISSELRAHLGLEDGAVAVNDEDSDEDEE
ncbi:LCP family protein [Salipaludibacillus aurantiacus]|uniref:Polyisoprenyl-teichoic acid--peptidoglycan teichoic acid transferase TagU n=1 Tax=Salipaludibacillus aurantiacus TaxID=1601833 RepID=A0A1H9X9N4_9BACI|nr:LCP family protein [Salipaludibacillus aurantiacus]SES42769.1 cell envelope-related function transcriptional attenuator common domain-containing protein [Salipaludibacillus aurantiacus]